MTLSKEELAAQYLGRTDEDDAQNSGRVTITPPTNQPVDLEKLKEELLSNGEIMLWNGKLPDEDDEGGVPPNYPTF